ncbi:MAG: RNA polymerase sigma factor [Gemmatimonadaceae bacterium]
MDELLSAIRPGLLAFFERRSGIDTAEDLTQLTLIRISGALRRIDPERADSYISTVARNVLRTSQRMTARRRARESDDDCADIPSEAPTADSRVECADLVRAIHRACLTRLQPGLREVAIGIVRGQAAATIAAELQISPVTVRTRLMRARTVLRQELAPYLDSGEGDRRSSA